MNWLTSLFSPGSQRARKGQAWGQALSSTHEAFSIPSHSPTFPSQVDLHDPETATSASFSYPPQGGSYGYLPTSSSRQNSLLPLHHDPLHSPVSSSAGYSSLPHTWNRLRNWLAREYPELGDTLNYGILDQDLAEIEMQFGFRLPAVVRESYLAADGQEAESAAGCSEGLFFGLTLLPLEDVLEEWRFWREVDEDPTTGANPQLKEIQESIPPEWVRKDYSQRGWIPLIADKAGNYIGVDLNPAGKGAAGQVIVFGRDFDTKVVLFNGDGPAGWAKWLASFVDDLESGEGFEIGVGDSPEGSEDDIGYEGYFYDGNGRGQGDGGGDNGSGGGLRLTGEYRGWNVLEALADRSVRRWLETGVITEDVRPAEEKEKAPETLVGIVVEDSAAEVAIPVVADTTTPPANRRMPPANLPTISITKPPAPLPVDVPTPRDIVALPSPPDSTHSFEDDLESGHSPNSMKQQDPTFVSRRPADNAYASGSNPITPTSNSYDSGRAPPSPPPEVDLLVDAEPVSTPAIEPSSLPTNTEITPATFTEEESEPAAEDPDVTIRLVGGGGMFGVADSNEEEDSSLPDGKADTNDAASVTSSTSESSVKNGGEKKHKKTKSGLSGLKGLSSLGGLRKKDSVSSAKEVVADTSS